MSRKIDGRGIIADYSYDALNRLTLRWFENDPLASFFTYDNFTGWGQPHGSSIGRLVRTYTCNGAGCEDDLYSYDAMGRIDHIEGATPSEAGHASQSGWPRPFWIGRRLQGDRCERKSQIDEKE